MRNDLLAVMESYSASLSAPPGQLSNCRVLLVEDDRDHQPLLAIILRKAGAEVTIAENGREGVDSACAARNDGSPFDLIIMDLQMPVLNGLEALKILRSEGFTSPIVALTARATSTDRNLCIEAGFDDFLSKPIHRVDFLAKLALQWELAKSKPAGAQKQTPPLVVGVP